LLFAEQELAPQANVVTAADKTITTNAQRMVDQGRQIFRFDTFGSETFWGDAPMQRSHLLLECAG